MAALVLPRAKWWYGNKITRCNSVAAEEVVEKCKKVINGETNSFTEVWNGLRGVM